MILAYTVLIIIMSAYSIPFYARYFCYKLRNLCVDCFQSSEIF